MVDNRHGGDGVHFGSGFRWPYQVPGLVFEPDEYALKTQEEWHAREEEQRKLDQIARDTWRKGPRRFLLKKSPS